MEQYIVLRDIQRRSTWGPFESLPRGGGPQIASQFPPEPRIELESLERKDRVDLLRDPEVAVISRPMPITLIAPVEASANYRFDGSQTWGIHAVGADSSQYSGKGVVIAVLDTGIDRDHSAFAGVDLIERDFTGTGSTDEVGHGTHCAGTIFGRDVQGMRIGVAKGVEKALIGKVLGPQGGSSEMIFSALNWASESGADVISMSLGFDFPGQVRKMVDAGWPPELATSEALQTYRGNLRLFDALLEMVRAREAFGTGTVVVAASGNESKRPKFVIGASLPAAATTVTSVGAVGQAGGQFGIAPFSNSFPLLCAPGVDIISAQVGGGCVSNTGTSMACPHVAGVAALWCEFLRTMNGVAQAAAVNANLVASARPDVFVSGTLIQDRGSGLVTAPQLFAGVKPLHKSH